VAKPPEHDPDRLDPGMSFEGYRLGPLLGQGGMGRVYEAVQEFTQAEVAIKILRRDISGQVKFVERLREESVFHSKLQHPNIPRLLNASQVSSGPRAGLVYLVMERIRGKTLRKVLDHHVRLDYVNSLYVLLQIADAVAQVHAAHIWHRDLKPDNVMIGTTGDQKGHVWVHDFGLAQAYDAPLSETGAVLGTVLYLAPEQVAHLLYVPGVSNGPRPRAPNMRADIYGFGAIAYETLTGQHIFNDALAGSSDRERLTMHLTTRPIPISELCSDCPSELEAVIMRCLQKDPDLRWQSMDEVADALREQARRSIPEAHPLAKKIAEERVRAKGRAAYVAMEAVAEEAAPSRMALVPCSSLEEQRATRPMPSDFVLPDEALPAKELRGVGFTERMPVPYPAAPVRAAMPAHEVERSERGSPSPWVTPSRAPSDASGGRLGGDRRSRAMLAIGVLLGMLVAGCIAVIVTALRSPEPAAASAAAPIETCAPAATTSATKREGAR
jgi:hypothetical protein